MPNYCGDYTLPILYDKKLGIIVNNDCYEISKMFNKEFHSLALNKTVDLFPTVLGNKIEENYYHFNQNLLKKVYEAGLCKSQDEYENAYDTVYESIEKVDKMLQGQQYLLSDKITFLDLIIYMNLIRFDCVYLLLFRCNKRAIRSYTNLSKYVRCL